MALPGTSRTDIDLPSAEDIWTYGGVLAALSAAGLDLPWCHIGDLGMAYEDGGGNRWTLVWVDDEHAVLVGADSDYSETSWHEPPIDLLAGAPDWFPHDWFARADDGALGFVFWWDGRWRRAPYPDTLEDDGHSIARTFEGGADSLHEIVHERIDEDLEDVLTALLAAAETRSIDEAALSAVFSQLDDPPRGAVPLALATADEAGLTPGGRRWQLNLIDEAPGGEAAEAHRRLLEAMRDEAFAPGPLRDHLRDLRKRRDSFVLAEAREIAETFLSAGHVPYPEFVTDLAEAVAQAAGTAGLGDPKKLAAGWVAEPLLRHDLLRRSPLATWEGVRSALSGVCRDSAELLDLLIAARPVPDAHPGDTLDPACAEWLKQLAWAGAADRLTPDWFAALGPVPAAPFTALVSKAADRLFGPSEADASDPAVRRPGEAPLAFRAADARRRSPSTGPGWALRPDYDALVQRLRDDPGAFLADMDWAVRTLNNASNVDYGAFLRGFRDVPELRTALTGHIQTWLAWAASGDLLGLEVALPHLTPLTDAGFAVLAPDLFAALTPLDPVDVLHRTLRTGIPEELTPITRAAGEGRVTMVQHRDLLTLETGGGNVEVHGPNGIVRLSGVPEVAGWFPWHDGESLYLSQRGVTARATLRVENGGKLSFVPDTSALWPDAPSFTHVTFPGASEPVSIRVHQGLTHITAPDGALTHRADHDPNRPADNLIPPPGWWPEQSPADPAGSRALRALDRETTERLVDAALREAADLTHLLPEITDPRLRQAVDDLVRRTATVLPSSLRLRDNLGIDRPERLPALLRRESGPPGVRDDTQVVAIRILAEHLMDAARHEAGETRLLDTVPLPSGARGIWFPFGELGGRALMAAWPWTTDGERHRALAVLRAWADTPWTDGSGRWRLHSLTTPDRRAAPEGQLWRTPSGSLLMLSFQGHPHRESMAIEFAPDGRFEPLDIPGWSDRIPIVPQGWGTPEAITAFDHLLTERGPAPSDADPVRDMAARTGLSLSEVASAVFGFPFFVGWEDKIGRYPQSILDFHTDPETGEPGPKTPLSYRLDRVLREVLMPDDPEDLWTTGPAYDRAADWWNTTGSQTD